MRVIVVGAGLGGLALAHGLARAGVDVEVFERSPAPDAQPASYGIHINADGARALHACLSPESWAAFDADSAPAPDVVHFRDQKLNILATLDRGTTADPVARRRGVRRQALHGALLRGIDGAEDTAGIVRWGRTFTSYRIRDDGRVAAAFADGTTTVGDLLVGADGSNSRVRQQYLPDVRRLDLGIVTIAGRLPASDAAGLPSSLLDGSVNNVVPAGPGWMFASTWEHDSLVWAYVGARARYPDDLDGRDGAALRRLVLDRITGWDPRLRQVVADTPPDTVAPVALRSMPVLPVWPSGPVTVLGDAIHNMTPMAGLGANTALRDADTLRRAVLPLVRGETSVVDAVARYEQHMRGYANPALALSTRNARNAASGARVPRLVFRALLRVAEAVPPVKRALFPDPAAPPARTVQLDA